MDPITLGIGLGSTLIGIGANIFGKPKMPKAHLLTDEDFVNPVKAQYETANKDLAAQQEFQYRNLLSDLRAQGVTGSGGSEVLRNIFSANNDARSKLNIFAADAIAKAIQQQKLQNYQIQYQNDMNRYQDLNDRFNSIVGGITNLGNTLSMANAFGGGGGASGFTAPSAPTLGSYSSIFGSAPNYSGYNNPFLPSL